MVGRTALTHPQMEALARDGDGLAADINQSKGRLIGEAEAVTAQFRGDTGNSSMSLSQQVDLELRNLSNAVSDIANLIRNVNSTVAGVDSTHQGAMNAVAGQAPLNINTIV